MINIFITSGDTPSKLSKEERKQEEIVKVTEPLLCAEFPIWIAALDLKKNIIAKKKVAGRRAKL